jgi:glutamyl-tRNA reductase
MNLLLAGVNHQTAAVALREKLCALLPEAEESYPLLLS